MGSQPLVDGRDQHGCLIANGELVVSCGHASMPLEEVDATGCEPSLTFNGQVGPGGQAVARASGSVVVPSAPTPPGGSFRSPSPARPPARDAPMVPRELAPHAGPRAASGPARARRRSSASPPCTGPGSAPRHAGPCPAAHHRYADVLPGPSLSRRAAAPPAGRPRSREWSSKGGSSAMLSTMAEWSPGRGAGAEGRRRRTEFGGGRSCCGCTSRWRTCCTCRRPRSPRRCWRRNLPWRCSCAATHVPGWAAGSGSTRAPSPGTYGR